MAEAVDKQLLTENAQPPERESPRPDGMPRAATNVTCFRCQQRGHRVAECPSKDSALSTRQITCFAYQKKGHYASDCPSVQHRRNESNIKTKPKSSVSMIQSDAPSNSAEQVDDTLDAQLQRVESQLRALQFQKAQKEGRQVRGVKPPGRCTHCEWLRRPTCLCSCHRRWCGGGCIGGYGVIRVYLGSCCPIW